MNDFKTEAHSLLTANDMDDKNSITHSLKVISEDPIEVIDEESAKKGSNNGLYKKVKSQR